MSAAFVLKDEPCEQYCVTEHDERTDRGKRVADLVARVYEPHPNGHNDRTYDPNPHLGDGQSARLHLRAQAIVDAKQEQCDKTEEVEMRVSRVSGVIVSYRHLQAPEHSNQQQQHCGFEAQVRCDHDFTPVFGDTRN